MLWIFETKSVSDLADRSGRIKDPFFGEIYHNGLDVFLGSLPSFLFYQVSEIIGRKIEFLSTIGHGRQAQGLRFFRSEIII